MKLILIRHTTTPWNREGRVQGRTDIELDEGGRHEAGELAKVLAPLGIERIISSDLKRASQTAEIIARDLKLRHVLDERLRECSFGELEGTTKDEMIVQHGEVVLKDLENNHHSYDFSRFGGEKHAEVLARHKNLADEHAKITPDATILFVGHGRGLNTLLASLGSFPNLQRGEYRVLEI